MIDVPELAEGVRSGSRRALARAITLVESTHPDQRARANALVELLLPESGGAVRIGISGVPGVGKSTFIEAFGGLLIEAGKRVAVLAVDPSSKITGGSIMGDKLRMERLARSERAFIRPSPSAGSLGGVTRRTRETMILCEAAGHDVVLVETVGVGQSEVAVADMVDFFLLLMLPGAGDEIQGIKRGIIELADAIVVNKADGQMVEAARRARRHYRNAIHFAQPKYAGLEVPILLVSALREEGIDAVWEAVTAHHDHLRTHGLLDRLRRDQARHWFESAVLDLLGARLERHEASNALRAELIAAVSGRRKSPYASAETLVDFFLEHQ